MNKKTKLISSLAAILMSASVAQATTPETVSPWDKDDGQWITIAGKITEAGVNLFTLDYGKGSIIVEMDDYDKKLEGYNLVKNDRVLVTGRVDADKGQQRTIEAGSVYVENIGKSFFASADDEEEVMKKLRQVTTNGTSTVVTGKVILIVEKIMTIDTGFQVIDVSTEVLKEDAFDTAGSIQIEKNDQVTVYGAITDGFTKSRKLVATHIVER